MGPQAPGHIWRLGGSLRVHSRVTPVLLVIANPTTAFFNGQVIFFSKKTVDLPTAVGYPPTAIGRPSRALQSHELFLTWGQQHLLNMMTPGPL